MATSSETDQVKNETPLIDLSSETETSVDNSIKDKGGGDKLSEDRVSTSSASCTTTVGCDELGNCDTDGQKPILATPSLGTIDSLLSCEKCISYCSELNESRATNTKFGEQITALKSKLEIMKNELEREVQRRCELEQRFTEEAKRSTDQIGELVAKSDQDDAKLKELRKKFEIYSNETSTMIESFTTNREVMSSQLLELRRENDYLLGKFISRSRDLQNESINLPQTVEELQFHCLTLNEKLICATLAKEQLEDVLSGRARNQ